MCVGIEEGMARVFQAKTMVSGRHAGLCEPNVLSTATAEKTGWAGRRGGVGVIRDWVKLGRVSQAKG